jgi:hypothetical protein
MNDKSMDEEHWRSWLQSVNPLPSVQDVAAEAVDGDDRAASPLDREPGLPNGAVSPAEFQASVQRLQQSLAGSSVMRDDGRVQRVDVGLRSSTGRRGVIWGLVGVAAAAMLILWQAWPVVGPEGGGAPVVVVPEDDARSNNPSEATSGQVGSPPGGPLDPERGAGDPMPEPRRDRLNRVQDLLRLSPSRLARVQMQLDRKALDQELQTWLKAWSLADLPDRERLEKEWVTNRGFWVSWTLSGLREWNDPRVLQAGIQLLSIEFGPRACETLEFCLERDATRVYAGGVLIPLATETQLVAWLKRENDAALGLAMIQQLSTRGGEVATSGLIELALDPICRNVLSKIPDRWHVAHEDRAMRWLLEGTEAQQFQAAALLTAINRPQVEQRLVALAEAGRHTVITTAVLLLRANFRSEALPPQTQQSRYMMASLPSADRRAKRWLRQQQVSQTVPSPFRKVCQRCDLSI